MQDPGKQLLLARGKGPTEGQIESSSSLHAPRGFLLDKAQDGCHLKATVAIRKKYLKNQ
jgi:hypothetical protein